MRLTGRIDQLNLNPSKSYDSPYLSMMHGEDKAVISYPGHEDLVLDFSSNEKREE